MKLPFTRKELVLRERRDSDVTNIISDPALAMRSRAKPMLLSTVYRCVDLISDSVAVLPLETYKVDKGGFKTQHREHSAYELLDLEPNENMTRFCLS